MYTHTHPERGRDRDRDRQRERERQTEKGELTTQRGEVLRLCVGHDCSQCPPLVVRVTRLQDVQPVAHHHRTDELDHNKHTHKHKHKHKHTHTHTHFTAP